MISVIIPTCNYGKYILQALHSLQNQSYSDWECIIVDDGSTDNTRQIVLQAQMADKRIIYLHQQNSGPAIARNLGIEKSKGEFIFFLDADDILEKDKLKSHIKVFEKFPDTDIAYGDVRYFMDGESGSLFYSLKPENLPWTAKYSGPGNGLVDLIIKQNVMVTSSPLIKKEVLEKTGSFDPKLLKLEDWELFQRWAINNYMFRYVDSPNSFVLIRAHSTSFSYNKRGMREYFLPIFEKHISASKLSLKNRLYVSARILEEYTDLILVSISGKTGLPKHYYGVYAFILPFIAIAFLPFYFGIKIFRFLNELKSNFFKNVFVLLLGAGFAQVITLLFTTFLTRVYSPADFGILSLYLTTAGFLTVIFSGRYELAIMLPEKDSKAFSLLQLSSLLLLSFSALFYLSIFFLNDPVIEFFGLAGMKSWLWFIPLSVVLLGLGQIFSYWAVRLNAYKFISIARVAESVTTGIGSLLFSFFGTAGLLIGNITGQFISPLIFFFKLIFKNKNHEKAGRKDLVSLAKEYSAFPRINILQSLIDLFQFSGIVFFLSLFFSVEKTGHYALCIRILQVPMGLVIKPIAQVFFSEASKIYSLQGDLVSLTRRIAAQTALIVSPVLVAILVAGPFLFSFLFGENWREAGIFAQIMVIWVYFDFIRAPISQLAIILRKQSTMLLLSLIGNILLVAGLGIIAFNKFDFRTGLLVVTLIQSVYTCGIIYWLIKLSGKDYKAG